MVSHVHQRSTKAERRFKTLLKGPFDYMIAMIQISCTHLTDKTWWCQWNNDGWLAAFFLPLPSFLFLIEFLSWCRYKYGKKYVNRCAGAFDKCRELKSRPIHFPKDRWLSVVYWSIDRKSSLAKCHKQWQRKPSKEHITPISYVIRSLNLRGGGNTWAAQAFYFMKPIYSGKLQLYIYGLIAKALSSVCWST